MMVMWFILLAFKIISGLILGMTMGIIVQVWLDAGVFSLVFVTLVFTSAFVKLVWHYQFMGLAVVDLFFISLFLVLKLYVSAAAA